MSEAVNILNELGMHNVFVLGVSKDSSRKAGFELLHRADTGEELSLPASALALHLVQHIRDEAHRFAIIKHRQARGKARSQSPIEGIPGSAPRGDNLCAEALWWDEGAGSRERNRYCEGDRDEPTDPLNWCTLRCIPTERSL